MIEIPWARPKSKFTNLFEYLILTLARSMPILDIACLMHEYDTKIWRVVHHYIREKHDKTDWSDVSKLGIDETSSKKGHNYVSTFVDIDSASVLYAAEGKDASTVNSFAEEMPKHQPETDQVKEVAMDMSPAFLSGVEKNFPSASVTYDKFHVIKQINEAVDIVRRTEQKHNPLLKGTRYIWLKNPENLTEDQAQKLKTLSKENTKTGKAYRLK
jgi:transposase